MQKQDQQDARNDTGGNRLFPVFLKLEDLQLLIVGAGNVGLEKLTAVLTNAPSTQITVVAKEISPAVRSVAENYRSVSLIKREFTKADLEEKDLVIVSVND